MFATAKLYMAGGLILAVAAAVGYHVVKVRTLEAKVAKLEAQLVQTGYDAQTAKANHASCEKYLAMVQEAMNVWTARADRLEADLDAKKVEIEAARKEAAKLRQELLRPLPQQCEAAVREAAGRVIVLFAGGEHGNERPSPIP